MNKNADKLIKVLATVTLVLLYVGIFAALFRYFLCPISLRSFTLRFVTDILVTLVFIFLGDEIFKVSSAFFVMPGIL